MVLGGTAQTTATQVYRRLEALGDFNAITGAERTYYYIHGTPSNILTASDTFADLFTNAHLAPAAVEHERQVILNEIGQAADDPDNFLGTQMDGLLYAGHPLAQPVLGTTRKIQDLPRQVLVEAMAESLRPPRMTITVTGQVDHDLVVERARAQFADLHARHGDGAPHRHRPTGLAVPLHPGQQVLYRDIDRVHLRVGMAGFGITDPRRDAFQVMMTVLVYGLSSRLTQELRDDHGLVYAVILRGRARSDTGYGALHTGCRPKDFPEVLTRIRQNLDQMGQDGITPQELERAKSILISLVIVDSEQALHRTRLLQDGEMVDRYQSTQERIAGIDAVTVEEVGQVAHQVLGPGTPRVEVAQGPLPQDALDH